MKTTQIDVVSYNLRIVAVIKKEHFINPNILNNALNICNQNKEKLNFYLLRNELITAKNLEHLMVIFNAGIEKKNQKQIEFNNYDFISKLGEGGMGIVYKVKDPISQEILVLKTLQKETYTKENLKRFIKEAKAISLLDHPNIVQLHQFGKEKNWPYFTMNYIKGISFEEMIDQKKGTLDLHIEIIKKIALALDYAHKQKIIHRDIKPANILLDQENKPYLTDFGLVKWVDKKSSLTQEGALVGTLSYLSPEQARGQKDIDHRTDVYSLGMILYEVLTNTLPFEYQNFAYMYKQILKDIPISPKKINASIPKKLDIICMKAISKKTSQRHQTAFEFAEALENYQNKQGFSNGEWILRTKRWLTRHQKIVIWVCCFLLSVSFLIAGYFYLLTSKKKTIPEYLAKTIKNDVFFVAAVKSGQELFKNQKYDKAIIKFKSAHQINTTSLIVNNKLARCYMKEKNYKLAIKHLNACIQMKPWDDEYFQLKGESHKNLGELELAAYNFLNSMELNNNKSYLIEEVLFLLKENISLHTRFSLLAVVTKKILTNSLKIEIDLFKTQKESLSKEIMLEKIPNNANNTNNANEKNWLRLYFSVKDKKYKEAILRNIASYQYASIKNAINSIPKLKEKSKQLLFDVQKKKLKQALFDVHKTKLRKLIIKYNIANDKKSLIEIEKMNQTGVPVLQEMLMDKNENEILRYYIAESLWHLNGYSFFENLMRNTNQSVGKLIARIVLLENQRNYNFNALFKKTISLNKKKTNDLTMAIKIAGPFLRMHIIKHTSNRKILRRLIRKKKNLKVRLYAIEKLLLLSEKNKYIFEEIKDILENSKNEFEKAFAINLLWNNKSKNARKMQKKLENRLIQFISDKKEIIQRVAISKSINVDFNKTKNKYLENLNNNNFFIKLHSIAALSIHNAELLDKIILDKKKSSFLRIFTFLKRTQHPSAYISIKTLIPKIFQEKKSIVRFMTTYYIYNNKKFPFFYRYIKKFNPHPLPVSLSLNPSSDVVNNAKKWMDDPDPIISDVATVSSVYNDILMNKKSVNIIKKIKNKNLRIQKAASFACSYYLYEKYYFNSDIILSLNIKDNKYYEFFFYKLADAINQHKWKAKIIIKCTFLANEIYSSDTTKLEKAIVLCLTGKYQKSKDIFSKIKSLHATGKYWEARVHLKLELFKKANFLIIEAINKRPWSPMFRKLKLEIEEKIRNKQK